MSQKFAAVERHLYRRQYQTADGNWSTLYYGIFTCWDKIRRTFPLAENLSAARDELGRLRNLNRGRFPFDAEKREQQKAKVKALTLSEYLDKTYLPAMKSTPSYNTKVAQCGPLKRLLGHLPLADVTKLRILEYKARRLAEPLMRQGKPVEGSKITGATCNREVSCLVAALNLAAESKLIDDAPRIRKKERERETARKRTLADQEYTAILEASPRWLQRVIIAANEGAFDRSVLLKLTWNCIQDELIVIDREKTEVRQLVGISPALNEVLEELRTEYRRTPNVAQRIFTRDAKPIPPAMLRHAFDRAVRTAKVDDFVLKDFRHCARTRWSLAGLPIEVCEIGMGHSLKGLAKVYSNPTDDQIREAWKKMFTSCLHEKTSDARESARNGKLLKELVRGTGFEPVHPFGH